MRDATIAGLESIKERGGGSWVALPVPVYPRLLVKGRGRVLGAEQPPLDEGPTVINGDYRGQSTIKVRLAISQLPREPTFRSLGYATLLAMLSLPYTG